MRKKGDLSSTGISVITCTNRPSALRNILENYDRQVQKEKELIIILNNNNIDKNIWEEAAERHGNVKLIQLDQNISLGQCLNFGAEQAAFDIIAKFDDDDYYGPKYLQNAAVVFNEINVEVAGKATSFVYFEKERILALRNRGHENRFVKHIDGPSIIIRRSVLEKVKFRDISRGEDKCFCKDCLELGIKIYSMDRFQHIYMRHANVDDHTWTIENDKLLRWCQVVSTGEIDYGKYINR